VSMKILNTRNFHLFFRARTRGAARLTMLRLCGAFAAAASIGYLIWTKQRAKPAVVTLAGKVIVITGASTGIGAEVARQASALGAKVVLTARREKELRAVGAQCKGAVVVVGDATKRSDVEKLAAEAIKAHGHIDIWINNVGRGITRKPTELQDVDLDEMMTVNVKSALYGMQVAGGHFSARGEGHVINITSVLGRRPFILARAAYCASKHALNSLTASFAMEFAESHPKIVFSLVSPGVVYTEFGCNALHGGYDSRSLRPQGIGQEEGEVAQVILDVIRTRTTGDVYTKVGYRKEAMSYLGGILSDPVVVK
jgi:short-subunit dehydrogenase